MKLAARYGEDTLKELLIKVFEDKHKVFLTKNDIKFHRIASPSYGLIDETMVEVDLTRFGDRLENGTHLPLTEDYNEQES